MLCYYALALGRFAAFLRVSAEIATFSSVIKSIAIFQSVIWKIMV